MSDEREHTILINVTTETRQRMALVRTIIQLQTHQFGQPSWADVVQWLVDTVPIPELLAELCQPATSQAPKENEP